MRRIPKYSSEHNLYEQIARYLQQQYPNVIYRFDVGADLKLTPGQAAKHKRLHPERGYPDLFIAESSMNIWHSPVREWGIHFGLYLEIKTESNSSYKKDGTLKKINTSKNRLKCLKNCVRGVIEPNLGLGLRGVRK